MGTIVVFSLLIGFLMTGYYELFPSVSREIFAAFIALIAIVPTLSLATMEVSTASYSVRISRVHRRNPYLWYLISIYLTVIIFSLLSLSFLEQQVPVLNATTCVLAMYGIIYLVPYFLAMMRLLDYMNIGKDFISNADGTYTLSSDAREKVANKIIPSLKQQK